MLSTSFFLAIGSTALVLSILLFAKIFHAKQNAKTTSGEWVGGAISWPKALWLGYAIVSWFLFPILLVLDPTTGSTLRWVLVGHLASWWIRGPLELVMIYRWFNWTPVYGITHDIAHATLLGAGLIWIGSYGEFTPLSSQVYILMMIHALFWEVTFAALFLTTRPAGASKIYFASDEERYRLINRFTTTAVGIGILHLCIHTGVYWSRWLIELQT